MLDTRLKIEKNRLGFRYIGHDRINWEYFDKCIEDQYGTKMDFSKNVLKKDHSHYSKAKHNKGNLRVEELERVLNALKIDQRVLFPELADMPEATEEPETEFSVLDLESDFEKTVRKRLDDIETKLDMVLELESKINTINLNLMNLMERIPKPDLAKAAEECLRGFVVDRGRGGKACEFKLFMEELEKRNIPKSYARNALDRVGATLESVGYGKEKTMWVIMPEENKC